MKKTITLFLFTAAVALGADTVSVNDLLEVSIKDKDGNWIMAGKLIDALKNMPKAEVQAKVDDAIAAKADSKPLEARPLINIAKASGATVQKVSEDKVKAAEQAVGITVE